MWASRRLLRRAALASVPRGLFCPIVNAHIGPAVGAVVDVSIAFAVVDDGGIGEDHLAAAVVADGGDFHRDDLQTIAADTKVVSPADFQAVGQNMFLLPAGK